MTCDRVSEQVVDLYVVASLVLCTCSSVGRFTPDFLILVQGGTHVESPSLGIRDQNPFQDPIVNAGPFRPLSSVPMGHPPGYPSTVLSGRAKSYFEPRHPNALGCGHRESDAGFGRLRGSF